MSYIVSTRNPKGIYNILVESCKKHSEFLLKKKLKIRIFKKKMSLNFLVFFFYKIISLNVFFDKKFVYLKYKKFDKNIDRSIQEIKNLDKLTNILSQNIQKI